MQMHSFVISSDKRRLDLLLALGHQYTVLSFEFLITRRMHRHMDCFYSLS